MAAKSFGNGERTHAPFDINTILFRICSTVAFLSVKLKSRGIRILKYTSASTLSGIQNCPDIHP